MAYSTRGVARRHLSRTGRLSIRNDLLGQQPASVRRTLAGLATEERTFEVSECIYGWTVNYTQMWSHIRVRVRLAPDATITPASVAALQSTWEGAIEAAWNNRRACGQGAEGACCFTFDVEWVTSGEQQVVRVIPGPARSNMGTWDDQDTGAVAAHEFGHMIGHPDEYADAACPMRSPVATGTIMHDNSTTFVDRLFDRLARDLGSTVVPVPAWKVPV